MIRATAGLAAGLALLAGQAFASGGPVTAMSCVSPATKTFVVVGMKTARFTNGGAELLQYDARVGKLDANGEVKTEKRYELDSNMKLFNSVDEAREWVGANTVVVPLAEGKTVSGAILVNRAKKRVTIVDTDYETTETLDCLAN